MPRYDYRCKECNLNFFINCGINDSRENVKCTDCGSTDIARKFKPIILKGKRAKGYQDDSIAVKPSENKSETQEESKEIKTAENEAGNETKAPETQHTPEPAHDHCSPELDYD